MSGTTVEGAETGESQKRYPEAERETVDRYVDFRGIRRDESVHAQSERDSENRGGSENGGKHVENRGGACFVREGETYFRKEEKENSRFRDGDEVTHGAVQWENGEVEIARKEIDVDGKRADYAENYANEGMSCFFVCAENQKYGYGGEEKCGEKIECAVKGDV